MRRRGASIERIALAFVAVLQTVAIALILRDGKDAHPVATAVQPPRRLVANAAPRNATAALGASPAAAAALGASPAAAARTAAGDSPAARALRAAGVARHREGKVPLLYVHVYKSGGSTFCSTARASGKAAPAAHGNVANCNLMRGLNSLQPDAQLRAFAPYDVVCNEYDGLPVADAALHSAADVVWATTLRDPVERLVSHFANAKAFARRGAGAFAGRPVLRPSGKRFEQLTLADFARWLEAGAAQLDLPWTRGDFALRYFAGFDACAPGRCNASHVAIAKRRLAERFAVVLDLGALDAGYAAMHRDLGWPQRGPTRSGSRSSKAGTAAEQLEGEPDAARLMAALRRAAGERDAELWRWAKGLGGVG